MSKGTAKELKRGMKVTTLYLPAELVEKAKARGMNISEAVREYLKALLEDEETLKLEEIEKEIIQLEGRLAELRARREAIRKTIEARLEKENRKEAIRRTLEQMKAIFEAKRRTAGGKEETELNRELNRLKAELTRLTGYAEGSDEWTAIMRALNTQEVEKAVEVALRWNT